MIWKMTQTFGEKFPKDLKETRKIKKEAKTSN